MVVIAPDEHLEITYEPGEERAVAIEISYDGEVVTRWETGSKPWDAGLIQVRNVIAANLDDYDRDEAQSLLEAHVASRQSELRSLFE